MARCKAGSDVDTAVLFEAVESPGRLDATGPLDPRLQARLTQVSGRRLTRTKRVRLLRDGADTRCVVQLLEWRHHDLAEQFAGQMPAPGGLFAADTWLETPFGPRLADAETWADCVVHDVRELGWSIEVTCRIDSATLGVLDDPLLHRRGRYARTDQP